MKRLQSEKEYINEETALKYRLLENMQKEIPSLQGVDQILGI